MSGKLGEDTNLLSVKIEGLLTCVLSLTARHKGHEVVVEYAGVFDSAHGPLPNIAELTAAAAGSDARWQGEYIIASVKGREYWFKQTGKVRRVNVDHVIDEAWWRDEDAIEKPARAKNSREEKPSPVYMTVDEYEKAAEKEAQEKASQAARDAQEAVMAAQSPGKPGKVTQSPGKPGKSGKGKSGKAAQSQGEPDKPARPVVPTIAPTAPTALNPKFKVSTW